MRVASRAGRQLILRSARRISSLESFLSPEFFEGSLGEVSPTERGEWRADAAAEVPDVADYPAFARRLHRRLRPRIGWGPEELDELLWPEPTPELMARARFLLERAGLDESGVRKAVRAMFGRKGVRALEAGARLRIGWVEKAFLYERAYEVTQRVMREHPDWWAKRVRRAVSEELGMEMPLSTVYCWMKRGNRPNVLPLRMCPALGTVMGIALSDGAKTDSARLRVKDRDFAGAYARALEEVSGRRFEVRGRGGRYEVFLRGSPILELMRTGLWKVVAYLYPSEFLAALFSGDGWVTPQLNIWGLRPSIGFVNSNLSLVGFTDWLLRRFYGIRMGWLLQESEGEVQVIRGQRVRVRASYRIYTSNTRFVEIYAERIGFVIERKQRMLEDLVDIWRRFEPKDRPEEFKRRYEKINGRWVRRH